MNCCLQLMESSPVSPPATLPGTTQGAIKKIVSDDSDQIEAFLAHHLCEIAAAAATPVFTLLYLFFMDWRLAAGDAAAHLHLPLDAGPPVSDSRTRRLFR